MADYYTLLARKIGPPSQSTREARQAVYELARKALVNQLRAIQPPVAEDVIQGERRALDEAIARLEAESAGEAAPAAAEAPRTVQEAKPQSEAKSGEGKSGEAGGAENRGDAKLSFKRNGTGAQRPAAPLPSAPAGARQSRRIIGIAAILLVLVGAIALAALSFRERPEDLAKFNPQEKAPETSERGKFGDRIGDDGRSAGAAVPVAQKAEFYVASPQQPDKVEHIYNGAVVWRLENLGGDEGEPVRPAIRGDVDFPDAKLKVTILIQKNLDAALSASHTVNIGFKFAANAEMKGVKAIGTLEMRRPDAQAGERLAGIPVAINDTSFLIGLMRGSPEARNVSLLRAPVIIDLPLQLSDNRMATINLEKGGSGDRVFADAIDAWSR
jgi:hypothetical protein